MAGAIIEVKYFNTFLLKKVNNASDDPVWNGSFGIPNTLDFTTLPFQKTGYPIQGGLDQDDTWVIEESRIRGGYNNTSVDFGAKAYIVEDEPIGTRRFNALIYSGIFNSRTGINNTNVFSVGEDITKSLDPANGSIQKLYAEDTNLNIFQELKVSRALIDKDAIFSAEGGGTVTSSNLVIGAIQPYLGKYGISQNPESFGAYGNRKYFTDRNNNVVLRLSNDGITEISSYGMKDFFRDKLKLSTNPSVKGKILGAYDIYSSEYLVSIQNPQISSSPERRRTEILTLNFDEKAQGWVSFFDYQPDQVFSLRNNFYSVKTIDEQFLPDGSPNPEYRKAKLFRHYSNQVKRGNFYGEDNPSSITFVFNPNPTNSKTFKTIGYEGSNGWQVDSFVSDETGPITATSSSTGFYSVQDSTAVILSLNEGEYIITESTATVLQDVTASSTLLLATTSVSGVISQGDNFYYESTPPPPTREVVSFNATTGALELTQPVTLTAGTKVFFNGYISSSTYSVGAGTFGSQNSNKYHAGFNLKENKYVANLINNSAPSAGEVNFGKNLTGVKGFYCTVKMSTDLTTDVGGEKSLFSVESAFTMNNGY